jgi:hypothetical protein
MKELDECHEAPVFKTCLGGEGDILIALAADETISMWKMFEKKIASQSTKIRLENIMLAVR